MLKETNKLNSRSLTKFGLCGEYTPLFFFLSLQKRPESSKSCNFIGSETGRLFTILPANPGGIVGSFIHKLLFVNEQNR